MTRRHSLKQLIACAAATLLLAACGGGGGGGSSSGPSPAPTPSAPPGIQGVTPMEGSADTLVTVTGTGLSRVTSVSVGDMRASHTPISDSQLTFRVPSGAPSGAVALSGAGFSVQATPMFRVIGLATITAISASNALVSSNVTFTGRDLDNASGFWMGPEALGIVSVAPDRVTVRTPPQAISGAITIQDKGYTNRRPSNFALTVVMPMAITSFTPTSALPGDTITINGTGLTAVSGVGFTSGDTITSITVPASRMGDQSLTVVVPPTASTGQFGVISPYEANPVISQGVLTIKPQVSVQWLDPTVTPQSTVVTPGETLYKQAILISGVGSASCENCHGPAYIFKAASTATAISAAIAGNRGGMSAYSSWTATQINNVANYVAAATPPTSTLSRIDVYGSKLSAVTAAQIGTNAGWIPATLSNRLDSSLTLTPSATLPVGVAMPVELIVPGQPNVKAGVVNVQNNGALYLFGVEAAQVHSKQVEAPSLRLTPGRPFMVRAAVLSSGSVLAPSVTATVSKNGVPRGTVPMTGPAVLQQTYDVYANSSMFSAVIPGAWVEPGMQVTVSVATAPAMQMTFSPQIGKATKLQLVLVPITVGASTGAPPSAAAVVDALARIYPLARQDITVEVRPPVLMPFSSITSNDNWVTINQRIESIRQSEAPSKVYYGVVPKAAINTSAPGGFLAGLARGIPDLINQSTWLMSASGYDEPLGWLNADRFNLQWSQFMLTFLHELGHLHTRRHAPCSTGSPPAGTDPNFPSPDGKIGVQPLYSSFYNTADLGRIEAPHLPDFSAPTGQTPGARMADLMSYCDSAWFGDYNYGYVQQFLENRTAATIAAASQRVMASAQSVATGGTAKGYLVLSGSITSRGVVMAPAQLLPSPPIVPHAGGPYTMTVRTKAGESIVVQFAAPDDSNANTKSFTVAIMDPGPVDAVEISKGLRVIPQVSTSARAKAQSGVASGTKAAVSWALEAEHVAVRWNPAVEPLLSVTLVHGDGRREVIASDLTGGDVRVATGIRPAATRVELNLGSDVSARTITAN